jgi:LacI family transcriptional regulator
MKNSVNMQDIADALGLSRNTVSKAFNNQHLPEATKRTILNKAIEMGYKNLDVVSRRETVLHNKNILILTINDIQNLNFFLSVLRGIDSIVAKYNLNLLQYQFDSLEKVRAFHSYVERNKISGILCLETFNRRYIKDILALNIPVVFLDTSIEGISLSGNYDIVLMENRSSVRKLCNHVFQATDITRAGFVGDKDHCLSFYERFVGFQEALIDNDMPFVPAQSIMEPDEFPYGDKHQLASKLRKMERVPDVFFCANDFLAISLINALDLIGLRVPQDVQVIGYDNTIDARTYKIPLTTIDVDKEVLGSESIAALLNRIKYQEDRNRLIHLRTEPIYRDSTK